jgi:hypothetical protein
MKDNFSKTPENIYHSTSRHIPDACSVHCPHLKNLVFYKRKITYLAHTIYLRHPVHLTNSMDHGLSLENDCRTPSQ